MAATRRADAVWEGELSSGSGRVTGGTGLFKDLPVSWSARTEAPGGKTSPEELLAAAHAACFSMALSAGLARAGTPPKRLEVSASVTFDKVGEAWKVTKSELTVRGWVPGTDAQKFKSAADGAGQGCPISTALKGNVPITVNATLAS